METHNLKDGMIVKNHKELCELLSVECKPSGKSRNYQLDDFKRYFEYEKAGHKYIINKIYDTPITKKSRSLIASYIQSLILDTLVDEYDIGNDYVLMSKGQIFNKLALTNDMYKKYNPNKDIYTANKLTDILDIRQHDIEYFYNSTNSKFNSFIHTALNGLVGKFIIKYTEPTVICVTLDNYSMITECNTYETNLITKFQNIICKELDCENISQIYNKNLTHIFNTKVVNMYNEHMNELGEDFFNHASGYYYSLEYYYIGYKIMFIDEVVNESSKMNSYVLSNRDEIEMLINTNVIDRLIKSYNNVSDKNTNLLDSNTLDYYKTIRSENKSGKRFIGNGYKLIDYTIKK